MSELRSQFLSITSTGNTDYQPVDLDGAIEAVFYISAIPGVDGALCNEPYATSARMPIITASVPLVTKSNDNRLYFVSAVAATSSTVNIWIIRRG